MISGLAAPFVTYDGSARCQTACRSLAWPFALAAVQLAAGCGLYSGPCGHTFEDPVLVVREVRALQGAALPTVTIDRVRFNGRLAGVSRTSCSARVSTSCEPRTASSVRSPAAWRRRKGSTSSGSLRRALSRRKSRWRRATKSSEAVALHRTRGPRRFTFNYPRSAVSTVGPMPRDTIPLTAGSAPAAPDATPQRHPDESCSGPPATRSR